MPTSEARVLANRSNSLRSTGPKSVEGKERSRRNGLKHGMTGEGIVVPATDAAEVERRNASLHAEMRPKSVMGEILIRQMATLSVRVERGAAQEMAAVAIRVRHASEEFDQARVDQAAQLMAGIVDDPRGCVRQLRKSTEGIDLLVEHWHNLRAELTRERGPVWDSPQLRKAVQLAGLRIDEPGAARIVALSNGCLGVFRWLSEQDGAGLDRDDRKAWSRNRVMEWIDGKLADLEDDREGLDFETIELDRAEAGTRALFDPSKEATLARRYESEANRAFFRSMKEFRRAEAEIADREESSPPAPMQSAPARVEPVKPVAPLASSWETVPKSPIIPPMTPAHDFSKAIPTNYDLARGLDGRVLSIGRLAPASS